MPPDEVVGGATSGEGLIYLPKKVVAFSRVNGTGRD